MKSDQEFLEGIYARAELLQQVRKEEPKQRTRSQMQARNRRRMEFLVMAAVIAFLIFIPGTETKQSMEQMENIEQSLPQKTSLDVQNQRGMQVEVVEEEGILCGCIPSDTGTYYLVKQENSGEKVEYKILYWYNDQKQVDDKQSLQAEVLYAYGNQIITLDEEQYTWLEQQFSEILNLDISKESIIIYPLERIEVQ